MLVFQKDWPHLEDRCKNHIGIDPAWFIQIVAEINLYLPDDWRLTRSKSNFFIQIVDNNSFIIAGYTYRTKSDDILHIVKTLFLKHFFDQYDLRAYNELYMSNGKSWKSQLIESDSLNPNLYFFRFRPQNTASPLFARQYEKVKWLPDGGYSEDQFHRIHPLTKAGLDFEHYRWIKRWHSGDVEFVDSVDPDYHGKDFWRTPEFESGGLSGSYDSYRKNYEAIFHEFGVRHPELPLTQATPYEIEYKFMILGDLGADRSVARSLETRIIQMGFFIDSPDDNGRCKEQTDVYFDDETFSLHRVGASFRVRQSRDNVRVTFKKRLPLKETFSKEGLYERSEEEAVITTTQRDALLCGEAINALPYRLISYVAPYCGKLQRVIEVTNNRRTIPFRDAAGRSAEICFDRVTYCIGGQSYGPYSEVEIESKGMPHESLRDVAAFLEEGLGLIPSRQSKYERGVSLLKTVSSFYQTTPKEKKFVIIDTDCGVDDALALILALKSSELDVKAITTVAGNVDLNRVKANVWKVLHALKLKPDQIPIVASGAARPLKGVEDDKPFTADSVHGQDGLGDAFGPPEMMAFDERKASDVICDVAKQYPKQVTLITVGPLTNLALAIRQRPEDVKCLKEVVAMGGVFFNIGNVAPNAEFNVRADPDAAEVVVEFCKNSCMKTPVDKDGKGILLPTEPTTDDYKKINAYKPHDPGDQLMLPLTFVGLDVTHRVLLRKVALDKALKAYPQNELLKFVLEISKKYMSFYYDNEELPGCYLHDPLAVAFVINPAFLSIDPHIVRVETKGRFTTGVIYPDDRPTRNPAWRNPAEEVIQVAHDVEREAFEEFFFRRIIQP